MVNVSIAGATGYTGCELIKILSRHRHAAIKHLISGSHEGKLISDIYPQLRTVCDIELESLNYNGIASDSDVVFLCLPHSASMRAAAEFLKRGKIVFDLSADYRFKDKKLYEDTYKVEHTCPEYMNESVYGLAEIYDKDIKNTDIIAVPGCYPTSILLSLIPLIEKKAINIDMIISDSKSGVSGAGKKATPTTHYCEVNDDLKPYGVFAHRHKPEIDHIIKRKTGEDTNIIFTPHLVPLTRGMLSTIYVKSSLDANELKNILREYYKGRKFIRVIDDMPMIKNVATTNFNDINIFSKDGFITIVSAIDNLLKGASGQAVQCFNLRMGFEETEGLL